MAEETQTEEKQESSGFDEAKMSELIQKNMNASFKELLAEQAKTQQQQTETPQQVEAPAPEPDFWDNLINPKVDGKVASATIAAQAAEDKVDFYSSDEWIEEVEEWLTEDDPTKRKAEKAKLREEIESTFRNLLKSGKGTFRKDIFSYVLGEKIKKDRVKYQENIGKKREKQAEADIQKARRAVDITSGGVSNFSASDIHAMSTEKMLKELGNLTF